MNLGFLNSINYHDSFFAWLLWAFEVPNVHTLEAKKKRLAKFVPMEASVMQEIGSPMYCLAVTRIVQTSSRRTVTRECSLKTILSTRTDSSCRRHLIGAKRSSMVITCSFVSCAETKHNRENSRAHCERKAFAALHVRSKFVKEFIAGDRLLASVWRLNRCARQRRKWNEKWNEI